MFRGQRYRVSPITSNLAFHYALDDSPQARDPEYVRTVIRSYIDVKLARGRTKGEISQKLELLEHELRSHAAQFQLVREEYRFPPSRVLLGRTQSHVTPPARNPPARTPFARRTTTAAPPRTDPEAGEDLPPPPYASQDPEPDSTRMLQIRLAAEAEAAANRPPSPPPAPPTDPEEARIWEESQLDEAKRASIAAERERVELEEAMRLSLAESNLPSVFEESESGPSSRRVSSYGPSSTSESISHRRIASDAQRHAPLLSDDGQPRTVLQSNNPFLSPQDSTSPRPLPRPRKPPLPQRSVQAQTTGDTVYLVDDSTSATAEWPNVVKVIQEAAARYDGIDVYYINSKRVGKELKTMEDVDDLFSGLQPKGTNPLFPRLDSLVQEYAARRRPLSINVMTAEPPTGDISRLVLSSSARPEHVPIITFTQIGRDSETRETLQDIQERLENIHRVENI